MVIAILFHREFHPYLEIYVLLKNLVNRKTPETEYERLQKAGFGPEAEHLLEDLFSLYQHAKEALPALDPRMATMLRCWQPEVPFCGADLLAYPFLPDRFHLLWQSWDSLSEKEQRQLFCASIAYALRNETEGVPFTSSSLVAVLEKSGLDSAGKYHILWLYHSISEAASLLQSTLNQAYWALSSWLRPFGEEALHTMERLSAIPDFAAYVQKETGIVLQDSGDLHVYPLVVRPDVSQVRYSIGSRAPATLLFWGTRFEEMSRWDKEAARLSESSGAVLRALGEKTKREILLILREYPRYGNELAERLQLKPATVSYHMAELQRLGLVGAEARQNRQYYTLHTDCVLDSLKALMAQFE